jgi:hypothetical protein
MMFSIPFPHFYIPAFYGVEVLAPRPILKLEDHHLSAVMTTFPIYSQSLSISDGHLLDPQPEDVPSSGDKDSYITGQISLVKM